MARGPLQPGKQPPAFHRGAIITQWAWITERPLPLKAALQSHKRRNLCVPGRSKHSGMLVPLILMPAPRFGGEEGGVREVKPSGLGHTAGGWPSPGPCSHPPLSTASRRCRSPPGEIAGLGDVGPARAGAFL